MSDNQDTDATMAISLGVVVGRLFADRYLVEKLLGRGGMGAVYRVRDRVVDEVVALKLLDLDAATPEAIERFRREVRLARRITHRNVARTYDLGEWQSPAGLFYYLTMEHVDGESLRDLAGRIRPSAARVVDFATQIARGLVAMHEVGVVHRDLKPANVLIERGGRAVITDFGIARGVQTSDATLNTGGLLGTPAYMSPEQIAGEPIDARSDLYALGLITYELLTNTLPFHGDSAMAVAMARLHQTLPDLRTIATIPAPLAPLLERLLAREVGERPAGAHEVVEQLEAIAHQLDDRDSGTLGMPPATLGPRHVTTATPTPTPTRTPTTGTPAPTRAKALAVLPFRFRGPEAERYVAESLSDELIDVLSTMKGLRVSGSGATARFAADGDRDPRTIGKQLGVDAIVDGTVQLSGPRIRVSARLLDVASGFQMWSERYDGALEDVFDLQDKMGKRIAEALRLELEHIAHRGDAPAEAIEAYLKARATARTWDFKGPGGAVAAFEACLALAPEFKPALAGHAIATLKAWFVPRDEPDEPDWASLAEQAVARAMAGASELAETHLAAAMLAAHTGRYRESAIELQRALQIAPTYAAAHEYLGRLQLEAGRPDEGVRHLELAFDLDPALVFALPEIARYHALRGDVEGYRRVLERYLDASGREGSMASIMLMVRVASWNRDQPELERQVAIMRSASMRTFALTHFGELLVEARVDAETIRAMIEGVLPLARNPRFAALVRQLGAELAGFHRFDDLAMHYVGEAAAGVLVDLDWLDRCPLLAALRERPEWPQARQLVRARAEAIWVV
ncbi:protein kinase domain-containing protein [Nannocystaceae bacterium ST9]